MQQSSAQSSQQTQAQGQNPAKGQPGQTPAGPSRLQANQRVDGHYHGQQMYPGQSRPGGSHTVGQSTQPQSYQKHGGDMQDGGPPGQAGSKSSGSRYNATQNVSYLQKQIQQQNQLQSQGLGMAGDSRGGQGGQHDQSHGSSSYMTQSQQQMAAQKRGGPPTSQMQQMYMNSKSNEQSHTHSHSMSSRSQQQPQQYPNASFNSSAPHQMQRHHGMPPNGRMPQPHTMDQMHRRPDQGSAQQMDYHRGAQGYQMPPHAATRQQMRGINPQQQQTALGRNERTSTSTALSATAESHGQMRGAGGSQTHNSTTQGSMVPYQGQMGLQNAQMYGGQQLQYGAQMNPYRMQPSTAIPLRDDDKPTLQNIVSTAKLGTELNLYKIGLEGRNVEYKPKRFAAAIMRIREPKTTALIFRSGKMVCTGAKSEHDSLTAAKNYAKQLRKIGNPNVHLTDFTIQNIVGSHDVGFQIKLEELHIQSQNSKIKCRYDPELFPGLIFRMNDPKVVLLIFASGKIVLTGAKKREQIYFAYQKILPVLRKHQKN